MSQIKDLMHLVCCEHGSCLRRRGHPGAHADACETHDDDVLSGERCDIPTLVGVRAVLELALKAAELGSKPETYGVTDLVDLLLKVTAKYAHDTDVCFGSKEFRERATEAWRT
jgi:hypothetical protein